MTQDSPSQGQNGETLEEEAAYWFSRMRGPEAEQQTAEFENWLARGALHRAAYNRAGEIFALGKFLSAADARDAGVQTLEPAEESSQSSRQRRRARWAVTVMTVLLAAATAWLVLQHFDAPGSGANLPLAAQPPAPGGLVLATESGQRLIQSLSDGSVVTLEAGSRLLVTFSSSNRTLSLQSGKARFDVAHEVRPFVVRAAGGSVTARGTVFDVAIDKAHEVKVLLLRGSVDVALPANPKIPPAIRRLVPGQTTSFAGLPDAPALSFAAAAGPFPIDEEPRDTGPVMDFDNIRVGAIIARANLAGGKPISLAAAGIAERRISGRFSFSDSGSIAERIALIFDLRVDHSDPSRIVLHER